MNIAVIGTGYVGLVTGTCLAELGNEVVCLDIDEKKIDNLRHGISPIYEPGLEEFIARNSRAGRLKFSSTASEALSDADIVFMALPTPPNDDGSADLSYVMGAAKEISPLLKDDAIVVNKSTVPAGTAEKVETILNAGRSGRINVASNPEFLREGMAVKDFFHPDRVVIGVNSEHAKVVMENLYQPLKSDGVPVLFMDRTSAEVSKYAANSFLATKISFMNEIANLCEKLGANVDSVRKAVGSDTRIGQKFLYPGIGYGGSCFPKDLIGLVRTAQEHGEGMGIVEAAIAANIRQREVLVEKIVNYFGSDLNGKHFALWGLAFKPDTDDIREAPARKIIQGLIDRGATVVGYDPQAAENMRKYYEGNASFQVAEDQYAALNGADALLIATEWEQFLRPGFAMMKALLKEPLIFDGRNIYDEKVIMAARDFRYESIGRAVVQG